MVNFRLTDCFGNVSCFVGNSSDYGMSDNLLDPAHEAYLEWLLVPESGRTPATNVAYAAKVNVNVTTLRAWKNKPAFKAEWSRRVNELQTSPEKTQALLDNLYERSIGGDNNAAKLYLQATGRLVTQLAVTTSSSLSDISDEELADLVASQVQLELAGRPMLKVVQ